MKKEHDRYYIAAKKMLESGDFISSRQALYDICDGMIWADRDSCEKGIERALEERNDRVSS
jgi:hypothetical protein